MSISNLYPSISPSLSLDFANVKALDSRISFTRTTTATYYNGVTTAKAEENLFLYSQEFNNAWWSKGANIALTTNGATAPDGTATAEIFSASGDADVIQNRILSSVVGSGLGNFTFSIWMRAATNQNIRLRGIQNNGATFVSGVNVAVTSTWTRFSHTFNVTQAGVICTIGADGTDTPTDVEIWGAQLEQRSAVTDYTPTTTQPITNYIPVLLTAASGVARFDHNPTTGESLGLLVEEQRTNSILQSEDFTTTWSVTRASVIANTIVSPNGTLTGDKLVEDTTASNSHFISQSSLSFTSGTTYSYSLYAKAAERTVVRLALPSAAFGAAVAYNFDLVAGTATLVTAGTGNTASITAVGNGWYRCVVSAQATSTTNGTNQIFLISGGFATYTGDGYSGIYIWGAQLEVGAFPTSYIPTVAATVTRNADAASMTGTNFSSWYRADEGGIYCETSAPVVSVSPTPWAIFGTGDNRFQQFYQNFTTVVNRLRSNGTDYDMAAITVAATGFKKLTMAYQTSSAAAVVNGGAATTSSPAILPVVHSLRIGNDSSNSSAFNGTIKKFAFYPSRLSNSQLQALTAP
jgi:hypothetical protein